MPNLADLPESYADRVVENGECWTPKPKPNTSVYVTPLDRRWNRYPGLRRF